MKITEIPATAQPLRSTDWLDAVGKELRDVEFYSPTMPLHWSEYHAIIDRLIAEIKKPEPGHGDGI